MHAPSLVKIHICVLKLSSGNKKTDRCTMDWHKDVQHKTIIPHHYCVAGYKNSKKSFLADIRKIRILFWVKKKTKKKQSRIWSYGPHKNWWVIIWEYKKPSWVSMQDRKVSCMGNAFQTGTRLVESLVEIPTPRVISLSCPILHGLAHDGLFLGPAWSCEIWLFILFFFLQDN